MEMKGREKGNKIIKKEGGGGEGGGGRKGSPTRWESRKTRGHTHGVETAGREEL